MNKAMKKRLADLQLQANALIATSSDIKARGSELSASLVKFCLLLLLLLSLRTFIKRKFAIKQCRKCSCMLNRNFFGPFFECFSSNVWNSPFSWQTVPNSRVLEDGKTERLNISIFVLHGNGIFPVIKIYFIDVSWLDSSVIICSIVWQFFCSSFLWVIFCFNFRSVGSAWLFL